MTNFLIKVKKVKVELTPVNKHKCQSKMIIKKKIEQH